MFPALKRRKPKPGPVAAIELLRAPTDFLLARDTLQIGDDGGVDVAFDLIAED